jgi:hypothetical protein
MEPGDEPNTLLGFAVRFFFGAVFGALMGLGWFAYSGGDAMPLCLWMMIPAILCGILAARFGDDFWHNLTNWWP